MKSQLSMYYILSAKLCINCPHWRSLFFPHCRFVVTFFLNLYAFQQGLLSIRKPKIFQSALWILGSYCDGDNSLLSVLGLIKKSLGELPIVASELSEVQNENQPPEEKKVYPSLLIWSLIIFQGRYTSAGYCGRHLCNPICLGHYQKDRPEYSSPSQVLIGIGLLPRGAAGYRSYKNGWEIRENQCFSPWKSSQVYFCFPP